MGILDDLWEKIRDLFTEEELNNLIIHEELERVRRQKEEQRREIQIPLPAPPPPSIYDEPPREEPADEDEERGVIIIDM